MTIENLKLNSKNNNGQVEFHLPLEERRRFPIINKLIRGFIFTRGEYSPGRIMAIMILTIIFGELIAMVVVYLYASLPYLVKTLLDITILTGIISPLLYILSFRPLLQYIQRQRQSNTITQSRLRLMQYAISHPLSKLLQYTLDEFESLTGSTIGFFHFLEEDQNTLWLQSWSTNTIEKMCNTEDAGKHLDVDKSGVWADCIRLRRAIIHNDIASLPNLKGMPKGHTTLNREMVVPIFRAEKIVAIIGLGNKSIDFTQNDIELVTTLADFSWDIIERKRSEMKLLESEEKFHTLVDWTYDWEKWLDPEENIVYISPSCERITGYSPKEFIDDPDLLVRIVHPDDLQVFINHHRVIHDELAGPITIEYRIISRQGSERWIEHICRPIFGLNNNYLGRRISNRDITERKLSEDANRILSQTEENLKQSIRTIRSDIGRDLHDTLGQNISFLRMTLENLYDNQLRDKETALSKIRNMTQAAKESYELIRTMLVFLQIENSSDPLILFSQYARQISERSSFQVVVSNNRSPKLLSSQQVSQLFYIFREALSNVEKYAFPSQVNAQFVWTESAVKFEISDDGCGFDLKNVNTEVHYGLKFMRERAELLNGTFAISSVVGKGTSITISIPYEKELFVKQG